MPDSVNQKLNVDRVNKNGTPLANPSKRMNDRWLVVEDA